MWGDHSELMAYIVRMPKLGVEMEQGSVLEWHASEGESIEAGELIAEIESEKTQAEVQAREAGVLRRILMAVGDEGPPGSAMGIVADPDESIDELLAEVDDDRHSSEVPEAAGNAQSETAPTAQTASERQDRSSDSAIDATPDDSAVESTPDDSAIDATPKARRRAREMGVGLASIDGTGPKGAVTLRDVERFAHSSTRDAGGEFDREAIKASPRARKRAEALGVDLSGVRGTGPEDGIVEADVERAATAGTSSQSSTIATGSGSVESRTVREERPQSQMRQTIARRLGQSWREAPHVTVDRRVNAEPLFAAVEAAGVAGYDVTMTDVLLRAVSETLSKHPEFNATFEDGTHTLYEEQNVGVAVDVDNGLLTPVLSEIESKSIDEIARLRSELVDKALAGDLTSEELSGGTFTISNLGVFGVHSFTPIINPPEVAILGVNTVEERPVKGDRGGIEFQRQLSFSLSFDHRVVDGADAARFLETLADRLEDAIALVP